MLGVLPRLDEGLGLVDSFTMDAVVSLPRNAHSATLFRGELEFFAV